MSSWDYVALETPEEPRNPISTSRLAAFLALAALALGGWESGYLFAGKGKPIKRGGAGSQSSPRAARRNRVPETILVGKDYEGLEEEENFWKSVRRKNNSDKDPFRPLVPVQPPGALQLFAPRVRSTRHKNPNRTMVESGPARRFMYKDILHEAYNNSKGTLVFRRVAQDGDDKIEKWRPACNYCYTREAAFKNGIVRFTLESGVELRLCSAHAREHGKSPLINPCRDCPPWKKKQARFRDEYGNLNRLCAIHAKLAGSHHLLNPCRDCPEGAKKEANFPDEEGNLKILCATHARERGTHRVQNPCRDCPDDAKKGAGYNDETGTPFRLCAEHARLAGTHHGLRPCRDCPEGEETQAHYPDEKGNPQRLCAQHAKEAGTYVVLSQLRNLTKNKKKDENIKQILFLRNMTRTGPENPGSANAVRL
eukprot:g27000.t1